MTNQSHTAPSLSRLRGLVDLMRERAEQKPEERAFTFLIDGDVEGPSLTYGEIDRRARSIAASLQQNGLEGERALLLYPSGLAFVTAFYGTLYAGVTAVTAPMPVPSRLARTLPRLEAVARDALPKVALTTSDAMIEIEKALSLSAELRSIRWLITDTLPSAVGDEWREPRIDLETLAFLQYTSGSTASPKGVMVSHGNLMHNSECIRLGWQYTRESVSVMWVPHIHDHGLVDGIVQPIYTGFRCILMPNLSIIQQPFRWLRAISRYRATHSGGPNFTYDLCVRKIAPEQLAELDLSSWVTAVNAAEPIRKETLVRFSEAFESCGFRWSTFFPAYGLAESTLVVSGRHAPIFCAVDKKALGQNRILEASSNTHEAVTLVGCGRPMADTKIAIINPDSMTRCEPDEIGEVWLSSPSVAEGYWSRPDETNAVFKSYTRDTGEGPFLRTGDLGFLKDGELFISGRLKDLIIVRGNNHYPQDIEYTAEKSHPALRPGCSSAFSIEADGEERVVLVVEVAARPRAEDLKSGAGDGRVKRQPDSEHAVLDTKDILKAIRTAVAEAHDLNVYAIKLLKPGTIPKTSSGKIQRNACRIAFLTQNLETVEE
jgi:acyl-CoA synthetase (AMP-forming)/AMP-acid ligase II